MQRHIWNRKVDWVSGSTTPYYYQNERKELYDENKHIAVGDIYFRLNKYLTGVTFTYINRLEQLSGKTYYTDIYRKDVLTGDGYSLVNMYNEYDVIDRTMKNIVLVDAAADSNIDIYFSGGTLRQLKEINDVKLKPGHLVLLKNQTLSTENDIYKVNNQHQLINSGLLSTREKSEKFSCAVKLGKNFDKQFFLLNVPNENYFPIYFEPKTFIEGKSHLIKNLINYKLFTTNSASTLKIIFTDYEVARKQLVEGYEHYNTISISGLTYSAITYSAITSNFVTLTYHHDEPYTIRSGDTTNVNFTGVTSDIVNFSGFTGITNYNYTAIPTPNSFDYKIGDQILLNIYIGDTVDSGVSYLIFTSYIRDVQYNYIILDETIPNYILTNLTNCNFLVENLNIATDWDDVLYILEYYTPYVDFYSIDVPIEVETSFSINTKNNNYDKYFDYSDLKFSFVNDTEIYNFNLSQYANYINYKLYDRLNQIDNSIYTASFSFFNNYLLIPDTYLYTDSHRIKLTTSLSGLTEIFKPYTYVNVNGYSGITGITLVYSVNNNEIIIEKPENWTVYPTQNQSPQVISIQNIDGLKNISDILYEVYMNQSYDWYIKKSDNERKYIARSYAELLDSNEIFRSGVTGILYENNNNEFILKLYDIENDVNLFFESTELVFVGADRKTRLPIPFRMLITTTTTTTLVLPPTTTTTTTLESTTTTTTTLSPTTTTTTTTLASTTTTTTTLAPTTTTTTTNLVPTVNWSTSYNIQNVANLEFRIYQNDILIVNSNNKIDSSGSFNILNSDNIRAEFIITGCTPTISNVSITQIQNLDGVTTAGSCPFILSGTCFLISNGSNMTINMSVTITIPVTTTTTTTLAPTTTTTTLTPTTTTTTTIYQVYFYYGVSIYPTVTESDVLGIDFIAATGNVGLPEPTGRQYTFPKVQKYKYWCIPDVPSGMSYGSQIIDRIINLSDLSPTVLADMQYFYTIEQSDPETTGIQTINYGLLNINGVPYRIYRTETNSSSRSDYIVYSF